MLSENRNMILAIVLSAIVLLGWQYYFAIPQVEQQKREAAHKQQQTQQQAKQPSASGTPAPAPAPDTPVTPQQNGAVQPGTLTRAQALAATPRVPIDTPFVKGS